MAITPPILTLPVELLQQVFSEYDDACSAEELFTSYDMLALRLVCKEFNAAVFDQAAAKYLSTWECCPMLPSQVDKLIRYLDTEAIASELKIVKIRMAYLEEMRYYDSECLPGEPAGARLDDLLSRFAKQGCMLDLELGQYSEHPYILEWNIETLEAVGRAKCRIQRFYL
ncbi:hypothetical protein LTR17_001330 [Elasticomyces elasticus]|nr:hypothetical protein LTR17_001330 [Elasticomyces elasticus]